MSEDYYDGILGDDKLEPEELGDVRAKVVWVKEGNPRARSEGYPWYEDLMDYNPNFDEDLERED